MTDDPKLRNALGRTRINVNEADELRYWTTTLKVNEAQLKKVVGHVGTSDVYARRGAAEKSGR